MGNKMEKAREAELLYGATEIAPPHFSADLLWLTGGKGKGPGFRAPDPFPLVRVDGKTYLLASSLEVERASKEARVDRVVSLDYYRRRTKHDTAEEGVILFLKKKGIRKIIVPEWFPHGFAESLRRARFAIEVRKDPFFPERRKKTEWEVAEIEKAQTAVERAVRKAMKFLERCRIRANKIYNKDEVVTSEILRNIIDYSLYHAGYLGVGTIVASGIQAADPHCVGFGPLQPYASIVLDVFPLSMTTHYYADQTRTIFVGRPSKEWERMYCAVLFAQEGACVMVRSGVRGQSIYGWVMLALNERGFPTNIHGRFKEGFIHSVGHGTGLDIHEPPYISKTDWTLQEGDVVSVEPGLYYSRKRQGIPVGGIRIEDLVVVTAVGCRNLSKFPKEFEKMVIIPRG